MYGNCLPLPQSGLIKSPLLGSIHAIVILSGRVKLTAWVEICFINNDQMGKAPVEPVKPMGLLSSRPNHTTDK